HAEECLVAVHSKPRITKRILAGDVGRPIGTAVVDDRVVPVRIGLSEHALDTAAQMTLTVVDGSDDTDARFASRGHGFLTSGPLSSLAATRISGDASPANDDGGSRRQPSADSAVKISHCWTSSHPACGLRSATGRSRSLHAPMMPSEIRLCKGRPIRP